MEKDPRQEAPCKIFEEPRCAHRDGGFMGLTHAASAVAVFLTIAAFFPEQMLLALGVAAPAAILLASLNVVGGAMVPDMDNSTSTAENALGILGNILSAVFRATSTIIQTTIRTSRDDSEPNPHRGFYHTVPGALLVGAIAFFFSTSSFFTLTVPLLGTLSSGTLFAILFSWANCHIALAILAKRSMKSLKKSGEGLGEVVASLLSLGIVVALFTQIPEGTTFQWLGVSVAVGMIIHSLGDCFTTAGCPVFFPLKVKGKLWYNIRLTSMKAGGVWENVIILPFFCLVIIVSSIVLVARLT